MIDNERVAATLNEIEEVTEQSGGPEPDGGAGPLLERLRELPERTDSGVALCCIARWWIALGGAQDVARDLLKRAEDFGGGYVDYSGTFDDFEEEDSYWAYLAIAVDSCLEDDAWVERLLVRSIAEDKYSDHVGDAIWFAANRFDADRCQRLVQAGTEERLDELGLALDLESLDPILAPSIRIFSGEAARCDAPEIPASVLACLVGRLLRVAGEEPDEATLLDELPEIERFAQEQLPPGPAKESLLALIADARRSASLLSARPPEES